MTTAPEIAFTLKDPTMALAFVLEKHRDAFFHFLLTGETREATVEQKKNAIDLVVGIIADEHGLRVGQAQNFINTSTTAGIQNLYVLRFFTNILK